MADDKPHFYDVFEASNVHGSRVRDALRSGTLDDAGLLEAARLDFQRLGLGDAIDFSPRDAHVEAAATSGYAQVLHGGVDATQGGLEIAHEPLKEHQVVHGTRVFDAAAIKEAVIQFKNLHGTDPAKAMLNRVGGVEGFKVVDLMARHDLWLNALVEMENYRSPVTGEAPK